MRFKKNVPAEHREFLHEQLKQYKKEMTMTKNELRELEKWVASGRSHMITGTIFIAKTDAQWTLSAQCVSRMKCMNADESFRRRTRTRIKGASRDYDTVSDSIIIDTEWSDPAMDPDAELPFS